MINGFSRYDSNPVGVDLSRSKFDRSYSHKLSMSASDFVPVFIDEVLPGDTFQVSTSYVMRTPALLRPVMDNAYVDTYFFYCPYRLVWDHYKEFFGENTAGGDQGWINPVTYTTPKLSADFFTKAGAGFGTLYDYFGLPTSINKASLGTMINEFPFRMYDFIWNEYVRDENTQSAVFVNTADTSTSFAKDFDDYGYESGQITYAPFTLKRMNKFHDRFTSSLPSPQKGSDVMLPFAGNAKVISTSSITTGSTQPLKFKKLDGTALIADAINLLGVNDGLNSLSVSAPPTSSSVPSTNTTLYPANLWAVIDNSVNGTINDLREALMLQRFYEIQAVGGTRYREQLYSQFGVRASDKTVQIPQYLAGHRTPVQISQVVQTSSTDSTSPQGNVSATSKTTDRGASFIKSFEEGGFILGFACVRADLSYQQGIDRMFTRTELLDYYMPVFAHLGEQPVYMRELYSNLTAQNKDLIFGYQEAWDDYRSRTNVISGNLRHDYGNGSLDSWHFAQWFNTQPTLSSSFIFDSFKETLDRCLSVPSSVEPQFVCDFYFDVKATRVMPTYSVPGISQHF